MPAGEPEEKPEQEREEKPEEGGDGGTAPEGGSGGATGDSRGLFAALSRGFVLCGTRFLSLLYEGLQAAGSIWVHPPPPEVPSPEPPRHMLDAPPDGHPERLCPQTPLSPDEIDIWARLYTDP
ncbi:DUF6059 family protein [Streptomyces sp. NPDC002896]|uniref:DUF6059 family protein n=1 Tax=Streptomyces sp. NPDC002896 TaxID=3154438 RepID=UPI003322FFFA